MAEYDMQLLGPIEGVEQFDAYLWARLEKYARKHKAEVNYEVVRKCIENSTMSLGLIATSGIIAGAILYHQVSDNFTGKQGVHIDFCHLERFDGVYRAYLQIMDDWAAFFGYDFMTAATIRPGWVKHDTGGWEQTNRIWSKAYGRR